MSQTTRASQTGPLFSLPVQQPQVRPRMLRPSVQELINTQLRTTKKKEDEIAHRSENLHELLLNRTSKDKLVQQNIIHSVDGSNSSALTAIRQQRRDSLQGLLLRRPSVDVLLKQRVIVTNPESSQGDNSQLSSLDENDLLSSSAAAATASSPGPDDANPSIPQESAPQIPFSFDDNDINLQYSVLTHIELSANAYIKIPHRVPGIKDVVDVACGWSHTLILDKHGYVYSFGLASQGRLGRPCDDEASATPQRIPDLEHATAIACGDHHSFVLTKHGLYAFGSNNFGQLGLGHRRDVSEPTRVDLRPAFHALGLSYKHHEPRITSVACGSNHTVIVVEGRALCCGWNKNYRLGLVSPRHFINYPHSEQQGDDLIVSRFQPIKGLSAPSRVSSGIYLTMITAGDLMTFAVSDSSAFLWGTPSFPNPYPVYELRGLKFSQISMGSHHCLLLSESGDVYTFGSNINHQLGRDGISTDSQSFHAPALITIHDENNEVIRPKFKAVSAGKYHSFGITTDGKLYSWGLNKRGILGHNSDENTMAPTLVNIYNILDENSRPLFARPTTTSNTTTSSEQGSAAAQGVSTPEKDNGEDNPENPVPVGPDPSKFEFLKVCGGLAHSIAVDSQGYVYSWGGCSKGKLGIDYSLS